MKKLYISFGVMIMLVFSCIGVFASKSYISDSEYFRKGYADNGYGILYGYYNTSTSGIENVGKKKGQYGNVTVSFSNYKVNKTTASVTVKFYRDGKFQKSKKLGI